jgi:hypothetical protein
MPWRRELTGPGRATEREHQLVAVLARHHGEEHLAGWTRDRVIAGAAQYLEDRDSANRQQLSNTFLEGSGPGGRMRWNRKESATASSEL